MHLSYLDVGLLGALSELDAESILEGSDIFTEFKGALSEQYVMQQIVSSAKYTPYYYAGSKSTYEMDFMIQKGKKIVPVEVKAEENLQAKSLKVFVQKYGVKDAVRVSMSGFRRQDWLINFPLYNIGNLNRFFNEKYNIHVKERHHE